MDSLINCTMIQPNTENKDTEIRATDENEVKHGSFHCYIVTPIVNFVKFIVDGVCFIGSKILECFKVSPLSQRSKNINTLYNQSHIKRLIDGISKENEEVDELAKQSKIVLGYFDEAFNKKITDIKEKKTDESESESENENIIKAGIQQMHNTASKKISREYEDCDKRRQKLIDKNMPDLACKRLSDKFSDEELEDIIQMTNQPVYQKAWEMEKCTYSPVMQICRRLNSGIEFDIEIKKEENSTNKRTYLFNTLIDVTDAVDRQMILAKMYHAYDVKTIKEEIFTTVNILKDQGVNCGDSSVDFEKLLNFDDSEDSKNRCRNKLLDQMSDTYASMSDDELEDYVNIQSSSAMFKLNKNITKLEELALEE